VSRLIESEDDFGTKLTWKGPDRGRDNFDWRVLRQVRDIRILNYGSIEGEQRSSRKSPGVATCKLVH
jgi:hypothetical protein